MTLFDDLCDHIKFRDYLFRSYTLQFFMESFSLNYIIRNINDICLEYKKVNDDVYLHALKIREEINKTYPAEKYPELYI